jgi:hypothetical protein
MEAIKRIRSLIKGWKQNFDRRHKAITKFYRKEYGHFSTVYYRDCVRWKILKTSPVKETEDRTCELHALTSTNDFINLIWGLKSFYYFSRRQYALCIHTDPSVTEDQKQLLEQHFPNARILDRQKSDEHIRNCLSNHPKCLNLRCKHPLAPKLFDFKFFARSNRIVLFDSDLLFFDFPAQLVKILDDQAYSQNCVNRDNGNFYTVDAEEVQEHLGFELVPKFNSGLGLIHSESINIDSIEKFLNLPRIASHFRRMEQTLFALCSSYYGTRFLPSEYNIRLEPGIEGLPSRHYVTEIRYLMYCEGIKNLHQRKFLQSIA